MAAPKYERKTVSVWSIEAGTYTAEELRNLAREVAIELGFDVIAVQRQTPDAASIKNGSTNGLHR